VKILAIATLAALEKPSGVKANITSNIILLFPSPPFPVGFPSKPISLFSLENEKEEEELLLLNSIGTTVVLSLDSVVKLNLACKCPY
jgi:hypothetical protein